MKKSTKTPIPRYVIITFVLVVAVVAIASTEYSSSIEQIQQSVHGIIMQYGLWAPVFYILAYTLIGLTGFSVTVLSLVALGIFDSTTAFVVIVIGASLSAASAYLLARSSNYNLVETELRSSHSKKLVLTLTRKIEDNLADKPFRSVLVLRFARLPYIALSYAAGLVPELSLKPFVAATVVSNSISALAYVLVGTILLTYIAGFTMVFVVGLAAYYIWSSRQKNDYN